MSEVYLEAKSAAKDENPCSLEMNPDLKSVLLSLASRLKQKPVHDHGQEKLQGAHWQADSPAHDTEKGDSHMINQEADNNLTAFNNSTATNKLSYGHAKKESFIKD